MASVPPHLAAQAFQIFTEGLSEISIRTVARKSHVLVPEEHWLSLPADLDSPVHIHSAGIALFGTTVGNEAYIGDILQTKPDDSNSLLLKLDKLRSWRNDCSDCSVHSSRRNGHTTSHLYLLAP